MAKSRITLTPEQEAHLTNLTSCGTVAVKAYRRATALLLLHQGQGYSAIARQLRVRYATVSDWANAFLDSGLQMLQDKPRSGRPLAIARRVNKNSSIFLGNTGNLPRSCYESGSS